MKSKPSLTAILTSSLTRPAPELDAHREAVSGRIAHLFNLDEEIVAAEDVGVTRRGAQVDAVGNAADAGEFRRDLLRHELAAEAGLRALGDVDLEAVRAVHVVGCSSRAARRASGR